MNKKLILIVVTALLYWILVNYVPYGMYVILPINLFVTFLHEFGHAFFALVTGGSVHEVMIQPNGAGYAITAGGFAPLILMGGYLGSAILGNLLLHIGICKPKASVYTLYVLVAVLLITAIVWFSSIFTSLVLIAFSVVAIWISKKSKNLVADILIVIGTASVIYIINDYNVGPSSDIAKFSKIIPLFPSALWAVLWLAIVVYITYKNLKKSLFK
ncbi:M50 family metallopeptidase [Plebeiibacterium marinum]|uniref:M50 family metallopeptidase n=1 Tax=Plebeiibacterium marinum TaxID=2992111 RepID=A0AAE3MD25_9BACT|nr:M50 family metallopeptidase [Plebeiobacterium marinum]MCW3805444.1 M50 family metallopeptidase [Plebeiobacterium marinum]